MTFEHVPGWEDYPDEMCMQTSDMDEYWTRFTKPTADAAGKNSSDIGDLDGRVTSLEQQIPVGPGGKGAYLNLGGTPDRWPLASEMVAPEEKETGFLVVARSDGIYFYNPATKQTIAPKKGGGTMAIHATFPQISCRQECIRHNTRHGMSGIYTAEVEKVELDRVWKSHDFCNVLVVVTEGGEEHQTAFHPDGMASRIFRVGENRASWKHVEGGTGGGGSADLTDVENRLDILEGEQLDQNNALVLNHTAIVALQTIQADHDTVLADHADRLEALELNGGGGTVDLTPVTDRLDVLEDGHTEQEVRIDDLTAGVMEGFREQGEILDRFQTNIDDHKDRIEILEAGGNVGGGTGGSSSFVGLTDTPDALEANKLVTVNADGTALEMSDATTTDLATALTLAKGVVTGDALLSGNCMGAEVVQDGRNNLPSSLITAGPVLIASVWNNTNTLHLPDIAKYDTEPMTAGCVREGRITTVYNNTSNNKSIIIKMDPALSDIALKNQAGTTVDTYILGPAKSIKLMPVFDHLAVSANQRFWSILECHDRIGERVFDQGAHFASTNITQATVANCRLVSTIGSNQRDVMFPEVVAFTNTAALEAHQVRQGKIFTVWGSATANMNLKLAAGQKFIINNVESDADRVVSPGIMETYFAIYIGNTQKWIQIARHKADGSSVDGGGNVDMGPINDRLDAIEAEFAPINAQISGLDTKLTDFITNGLAPLTRRVGEAEVEINKSNDRIDTLENKPHPSFFQLTNTPTAGRPGELIGYNMDGSALTSYKRVVKMGDLSDVPENLTGQATRLLTVKTDQTGYEFSDYPRIAPLQIAIENNKTRLDDQAAEDIAQKARLVDLEGTRNLAGHLPKVFDISNTVTANGRVNISGVYTVMPSTVGLSGMFPAATVCKMLVAVTKNGEELQTVFGEHAMASRVYAKNVT
ncbi:MAG: hypothetical protein ACRC6V_14700, partial [Bacteroidales bacterium]